MATDNDQEDTSAILVIDDSLSNEETKTAVREAVRLYLNETYLGDEELEQDYPDFDEQVSNMVDDLGMSIDVYEYTFVIYNIDYVKP